MKAKAKALNMAVYICDECDTVWKEHEPVSDQTGKAFEWFGEEFSIEPLWEELAILG